jgi:hypothetical protein
LVLTTNDVMPIPLPPEIDVIVWPADEDIVATASN